MRLSRLATSKLARSPYFLTLMGRSRKLMCLQYWNWGKTAQDPIDAPMFDGSATSMGGNGVYEKHNCTNALPTGLNCIPPGAGGGCVTEGPFKKYVLIHVLIRPQTIHPSSPSISYLIIPLYLSTKPTHTCSARTQFSPSQSLNAPLPLTPYP